MTVRSSNISSATDKIISFQLSEMSLREGSVWNEFSKICSLRYPSLLNPILYSQCSFMDILEDILLLLRAFYYFLPNDCPLMNDFYLCIFIRKINKYIKISVFHSSSLWGMLLSSVSTKYSDVIELYNKFSFEISEFLFKILQQDSD